MRGQLPVVSFRPEGHDAFMALMMLMVGLDVEVTYIEVALSWDGRESVEVRTKRGEIVAMSDAGMALKPHGIPKRYSEGQYRNHEIAWRMVKMLEVIG